MDDGSFTPRTERVTLGKGRFCTELPPLSGQLWVPNAERLEMLVRQGTEPCDEFKEL